MRKAAVFSTGVCTQPRLTIEIPLTDKSDKSNQSIAESRSRGFNTGRVRHHTQAGTLPVDAKLGMHGYGAPHPNYMCQMQQAHVYQTSRCVLLQAHSSEKQQRWTARKRTTTKSPGHAGLLQTQGNMPTQKPPACTRLAGTPLLFKVRVLKASTKNAGLTPLTPPQARTQ